MEQARILIAIALSFLVFLLWNVFVEKKDPGETPVQKTVGQPAVLEQAESKTPQDAPQKLPQPAEPSEVAPESALATEKDARVLTVAAPLYTVKIDEKGGVFKSYILKEYLENASDKTQYKELIDPEIKRGALGLRLQENGIPGLDQAVFVSDEKAERLQVLSEPKELVLSWRSKDNIVVQKRYRFDPRSYMIGLSIVIQNHSQRSIDDSLVLELLGRVDTKKGGYAFEGPSALLNDKLEQIKPKKIKDGSEYSGTISWIAIEDRYFMTSIIPASPREAKMNLALEDENVIINQLVMPKDSIAPATQQRYEYELFFGPKSMQVLTGASHELKRAMHFGMFDFIAKPCLWFMNFIYSVIPNYGIAIIILTLLTKLLLWPLGSKSYKSMNEMKRLQPLMAEIREKHKNDKKQMNQELMALYRTYKINPMGGCLPMVLQIPVFFALYRMLYQAIELRHAPFFLWINDLSAPDRLFQFGFSIPFMQPPYGIPVLTLVMGATMLLQQKMSPPPGDPTQAKMMMFMPIIFTVIFINFSSGLVLYWLVNNILSIAQQYYIQKKYA